MNMTTAIVRPTAEQYRAPQASVTLPTPRATFYFMVETLVAKGLAKYEHADPFRNRLPTILFLLVPPKPEEFDLSHLVSLIEVDGKRGLNYLDPGHLTEEIKVPDGPYLMVDIEDGRARLNTKPSVSSANIANENRSPYTTWRGIVHAVVFPEVFQGHNIDLVGSRYESEGVPYLFLNGRRPELHVCWCDDAHPEWGAPSCGSVIVP
ncbi:MAG: DUF5701 family protein [Candidatus Liptonbacteria bacterium]|nr:DUF5701 family protein [Candidatus Liptonbacteria bacterium]